MAERGRPCCHFLLLACAGYARCLPSLPTTTTPTTCHTAFTISGGLPTARMRLPMMLHVNKLSSILFSAGIIACLSRLVLRERAGCAPTRDFHTRAGAPGAAADAWHEHRCLSPSPFARLPNRTILFGFRSLYAMPALSLPAHFWFSYLFWMSRTYHGCHFRCGDGWRDWKDNGIQHATDAFALLFPGPFVRYLQNSTSAFLRSLRWCVVRLTACCLPS